MTVAVSMAIAISMTMARDLAARAQGAKGTLGLRNARAKEH